MQITINVPDNMPLATIQQKISEFEEALKNQSQVANQTISKWQKMVQKIETNDFNLGEYTEIFKQDRQDFVNSFDFKNDV